MGEKGKKKMSTAKLELDKSMHKRTKASNDTALESPKIWYTPPIFSNGETAKLYYQRSEKISIDVNAICEHFEDNNLKFEWECVVLDGSGYVKRFTNATKSPHAVISVLNNIDNDHNIQISAIISDINNPTKKVNAKNCITIRPVITPKEISDKIKWLRAMSGNTEAKDNSTFENIIRSTIEIYGYNGEDVTVNRVVILKGKVIFDVRERVIVSNNCLLVKFNRSEIINKTKNGDTVTLKYVIIVNAWGDDNYKAVKRDFKIDKHTLVEGETVDISQPVVCGTIDIQENTFKQCKYRKIEAEYTKDKKGTEKEKITIFQENDSMEPLPLNLIGGKRKVNITLSEYTPDKCRLKEGSHKDNIYVSKRRENRLLPISISGDVGKIQDFEIKYQYDTKYLLKTLWLPMNIAQEDILNMGDINCRHKHEIPIKIYPDTKWEAFFELGSSAPTLYSHTNMPAEYEIFKRHQDKARNSARKNKDIELSLGLQIEYDDGKELSFSADIESSVRNVAAVLKTIRDGLDVLSFKKAVDDNRGSIKARNILPKNNASNTIPVFIEISSPAIRVGGGWQYDYNSSNQIIRKGELAVSASPLIEVKGGLDLIACATFIPVVGQIIKTILKVNDLAEWLTKTMSKEKLKYEGLIWFNLYLSGNISVSGIIELSEEDKNIELKSPATIVFGVELGLSAEIKVETVTIVGNTTHAVRAGLSGKAETGLTFEPNLGYSANDGMYLGFKVEFNGIILMVSGEAKYEEERKHGKGKRSIGPEFKEEFTLIEECLIYEGKVCMFNDAKK